MAVKQYTRSGGAKSGVESYFIGALLVICLWPLIGTRCFLTLLVGLFTFELMVIDSFDRTMLWYAIMSQKLGPSVMRNASIGFAECVRPGGKPTHDHCLNLYHYSPLVSSIMFAMPALFILLFAPSIALVRLLYPEHSQGVPKSYWRLYWFLVRHPVAIQGEGPSNGDGLAAMNGSESIIYPITRQTLKCGPKDTAYWLEGKPTLRDMFHDKLFCHRFFESHGAPHPKLVAEVAEHRRREILLEPGDAPEKLLWKPRFSTMGLGVEKFTGWESMDDGKTWAPSAVPYVLEELVQSTEYEASEWYRMTTLWAHDEPDPKPGYCWRTRNDKGDTRVQTDIIGGAYCITSKHVPFVGPNDKGMVVDPRTGSKQKLNAKVEDALTKAIDLQKKMHKNLGQELMSIGWDVMVVEDEPIFIEFNINNGFFVADHSMDELEVMTDYYSRQFFARMPGQLLRFNPEASDLGKQTFELTGWDVLMGGDLEDGGWEESFISNTLQFAHTIPSMETTLRQWLMETLQNPRHPLRAQICRGSASPCYVFSDEPAEKLCDRMLLRRSELHWDPKQDLPEVDAARIVFCDDAFALHMSHVFFDGANAWKMLGELFQNSQHIPCPRMQYTPFKSETRAAVAAIIAICCGRPKRSLRSGPKESVHPSHFSVDVKNLRELRRACGGPFAASLIAVLANAIFQHLEDAGHTVPDKLHVGVLVGFEVDHSPHFNDYGVVPIVINRPRGTQRAKDLCRQAGAQLRQRAVMAEAAWVLTNVYNRRSVGVIDVYASLDFVVSCAPMTGGDHAAPLKFVGTDEPLKSMHSNIYITMPLYCIGQSYDSRVDLTFVSRAMDVPSEELEKHITNWASQA